VRAWGLNPSLFFRASLCLSLSAFLSRTFLSRRTCTPNNCIRCSSTTTKQTPRLNPEAFEYVSQCEHDVSDHTVLTARPNAAMGSFYRVSAAALTSANTLCSRALARVRIGGACACMCVGPEGGRMLFREREREGEGLGDTHVCILPCMRASSEGERRRGGERGGGAKRESKGRGLGGNERYVSTDTHTKLHKKCFTSRGHSREPCVTCVLHVYLSVSSNTSLNSSRILIFDSQTLMDRRHAKQSHSCVPLQQFKNQTQALASNEAGGEGHSRKSIPGQESSIPLVRMWWRGVAFLDLPTLVHPAQIWHTHTPETQKPGAYSWPHRKVCIHI
jgi:hypothetical protein